MKTGYDELLSVISDQADVIETQTQTIKRLSDLVALLENDEKEVSGNGTTETTDRARRGER